MTTQLPDPVLDLMPSDDAMKAAYIDSCKRMIGIIREIGEAAADTQVPACPAWTVRNLVAHVTSVARLTARNLPWGDDPQITIEREVNDRQNHGLEQIAAEWEELLPALEAMPMGPGAGAMVVDAVSHEHDLRGALGPTYQDHSAGLPEALSAIVGWVRYLNLVGDQGILLRTPTAQAIFGGPSVECEVDLADDWELFRLLGVRRSDSQLSALPQSGDPALLRAVVSRYPLPEQSLEVNG